MTNPAVPPSTSAFSSNTDFSTEPIEPLNEPVHSAAAGGLLEQYEILETVDRIRQGGYKRIGLQFPDALLGDSVPVYRELKSRLQECELYILADTTYGSCCVDQVAAEHVNADLVVHYGHACLSHSSYLPTLYILTKSDFSVQHAAETIAEHLRQEHKEKTVYLHYDLAFEWKMDALEDQLRALLSNPIIRYHLDRKSYMHLGEPSASVQASGSACCSSTQETNAAMPQEQPAIIPAVTEGATSCGNSCTCSSTSTVKNIDQVAACEQATAPASDQYAIPADGLLLYIGPPSLRLSNFLMTNPSIPLIQYEPTGEGGAVSKEQQNVNRMLMRRYAAIQKARDADVFGILVGTLGVARHLPLVNQLRKTLKQHQKKSYTLCVGKPTPSKLGNYQEIECFILVACPENSLLLTSPELGKDFYRPIITPWEAMVALEHGTDWSAGWSLGWEKLLEESDFVEKEINEDEDEGNLQFSSVTGQLRTVRKYDTGSLQEKVSAGALVHQPTSREIATMMGSAAGEHIHTLSYRGLDLQEEGAGYGITKGREGVARGYAGETQQ